MTCQRCGCSELNPCLGSYGSTCAWAIPGLCTFCLSDEEMELLHLVAGAEIAHNFASNIPDSTAAQREEAARRYREACR